MTEIRPAEPDEAPELDSVFPVSVEKYPAQSTEEGFVIYDKTPDD